jgi:hypothetical protein
VTVSDLHCNRLFSLGVEHSLSKRKVDGSNPSIGYFFFLVLAPTVSKCSRSAKTRAL